MSNQQTIGNMESKYVQKQVNPRDIRGHQEEGGDSPSVWVKLQEHLQKIPAPSIQCKTNHLQMEGPQHHCTFIQKWTAIKTIIKNHKKNNKSGKGQQACHLQRIADLSGSIWDKFTCVYYQAKRQIDKAFMFMLSRNHKITHSNFARE